MTHDALAPEGPRPKPAAFYRPEQYRPDQSVGYLMRRVLSSILSQADKELGQHDLTHAQWMPLYKLSIGECTMTSLARDLATDPGAMTRSLDRLEKKGLITRERSVSDRRVVHLALTPEGRQLARKVPPVISHVMNAHLAGFSEAEWLQLSELLRRMISNGEALRSGS